MQEFAEGAGEVAEPLRGLTVPGAAQAPYDAQGGRLGARQPR
ncbi:hypothetical protein [Streptomyces sp. NPDC023588]